MRIAIVNDTRMALEGLKRIIAAVPEHQIAWLAQDGVEAVAQCRHDTPDLILMDLIMPNMDGVEATRQIMQQSPCAILIVTSTVTGNTSQVFDAMGAGALDAVNTPTLDDDNQQEGTQALLKKIATIGTLIRNDIAPPSNNIRKILPTSTTRAMLVALGSSTGGPKALAQILRDLPADLPAAIVIVQHVDTQFSHGFAAWLNEQSALPESSQSR